MQNRHDLMMKKLCAFFKNNNDALGTIHCLLNKTSNITLRVIDWFITYYCKLKCNENYHLFVSYKLQLKSFSKKMFDPFCRGERIVLKLNENSIIETTVGQLNFFKWLIENHVIDAYTKDKSTIDQVMLKDGFKIKLEGRGRMKKSIPHVSSTSSVQSLPHISPTSI